MNDPMMATPVADRTIAAVMARNLAMRPDKVAIIDDDGRTVTYEEAHSSALRIASSLLNGRVARQDFVLVMLDNHIDNALTWLGLGLGAMAMVPINGAYKGEILSYVSAQSGARLAIIEGNYCDRYAAVIDSLPDLETIVVRGEPNAQFPSRIAVIPFEELTAGTGPAPTHPPAVSDVAALLYTSGTEGPSKGALVSHGQAFQISASYLWETEPDDVVLVALPMFHASGLFAGVYNAVRGGATAVIQTGFSASRFWSVVDTHGCTQTLLMGAMADFLWRQPVTDGDANTSLKNVTVVPAPPYVAEWAKRFGVNVSTSYGSAEVGTVTVTELSEMAPSVCGRPREFIELRVVDDQDVEVPRGTVGELVVRSHEPWALMMGYHQMPEATIKAWRNLWFHTGDSCYQDENGVFFFVDRKKDALRRRGENVSSMEVEKHLTARADIEQAAIVAVPSEHGEDEIKAVVVLVTGAAFDPESILREMADRLPYFMVPRYYEAVESLPMTPTHKVKKVELRKAGITDATWDCQRHGLTVTRAGIKEAPASV